MAGDGAAGDGVTGDGARTVVLTAFVVSAGVAVAKLVASGASGSSALLASTIQTLADMSAMGLLLFGLWGARADGAATEAGSSDRQLVFWGLVVASPIYALAAGIALFEGIERLARPSTAGFDRLDQMLVGAGAAVSVVYGWFALTRARSLSTAGGSIRELLRRPANAALFSVRIVAAGAVAGNLAALLGVALAADGNPRADAMAAIVIAVVAMAVSAALTLEAGRQIEGAGIAHTRAERSEDGMPQPPTEVADSAALEPEPVPQAAASAPAPASKPVDPAAAVSGQKPAPVVRQQSRRGHGKRRR